MNPNPWNGNQYDSDLHEAEDAPRPRLPASFWIPLAILILIALFALLMVAAKAHDAPMGWAYSTACCSGVDCREVDDLAIHEGPEGYTVPSGEVIAYGSPKVKDSPDGRFHWCSYQGSETGKTICLYVPGRGS